MHGLGGAGTRLAGVAGGVFEKMIGRKEMGDECCRAGNRQRGLDGGSSGWIERTIRGKTGGYPRSLRRGDAKNYAELEGIAEVRKRKLRGRTIK